MMSYFHGEIKYKNIYPRPSVNSNALLRSRDESNFFPLVNVPTSNNTIIPNLSQLLTCIMDRNTLS